jgi:UDP-perosamine 4-acetyltransferase
MNREGNIARRKVIGLGAGGHSKCLLDIISFNVGSFEVIGFLDSDILKHGQLWCGFQVLGGDELLPQMKDKGVTDFFVGLGSTGNLTPRAELFRHGRSSGLVPLTLVHPSATLSPSVKLGAGACIMAGVIVNANTRLGDNVCLNSGSIIEHDCSIADNCFVGPGAILGGSVTMLDQTFVGMGAVIRQGQHIGGCSLIAAGAVVVADVQPGTKVAGVPARKMLPNEQI